MILFFILSYFILFLQTVEFRINKGVLGLTKELNHKVWEFKGPTVAPHSTRSFHDLHKYLQVPVMPPTLAEVCKVIEIYYIVKVMLLLLTFFYRNTIRSSTYQNFTDSFKVAFWQLTTPYMVTLNKEPVCGFHHIDIFWVFVKVWFEVINLAC